MAAIRKRRGPGGRTVWQAQIIKKGYKPLYGTFDTKAEAQIWAKKHESAMEHRTFVSSVEAENTTLAQALERYRVEVSSKKKSASREKFTIKIWSESPLGPRTLASIRGKDIAKSIDDMQARGLGPHSIRIYLALLSHLFNVARTAWGMESLTNPVELVKGRRPKLPPGRDRRLAAGEYERLMAVCDSRGDSRMASIITWAVETAMREAEISYMRWERIDWKTRVLAVPWEETKTSEARGVPLSNVAVDILELVGVQKEGLVWRGITANSIAHAFEDICKRAGIVGLRFHDLRHEATTRLFEKRLQDMEVAAITGHKTLQMLKRYAHLRAENLVEMLG